MLVIKVRIQTRLYLKGWGRRRACTVVEGAYVSVSSLVSLLATVDKREREKVPTDAEFRLSEHWTGA